MLLGSMKKTLVSCIYLPKPLIHTICAIGLTASRLQSDVNDDAEATQHSSLNVSLRAITDRLSSSLDEDVDDLDSAFIQPSVSNISLTLNDLFDFRRSFWEKFKPSISVGSIDDELAAYGLDELDAEGEAAEDENEMNRELSSALNDTIVNAS